jgi:hypothetical protein
MPTQNASWDRKKYVVQHYWHHEHDQKLKNRHNEFDHENTQLVRLFKI